MKINMLVGVFALFVLFAAKTIHSCPIWAGPHKTLQDVADNLQPQVQQEAENEQWPMASWSDPSVHQSRVRRRDPLVPLNLEEFRRENLGPKPVWRDPNTRDDNTHLRKHVSNSVIEE
ncbi:uncharacterized protein LOC129004414 [Macrosteles quadrilineatus]|uniref:uncharacterized protein LOC129004414 n=1 Tax=Macrosteles quadrilineatus TaxID=74068 RepID=UPI0023E1E97A|nr:uncharacterized protein LOC129004414 [Macrosteles quadrilineatus]